MKRLCVYKKLFSFIFLGIFVLTPFVFLHAQTEEELRGKIEEKNEEIERLEEEIKGFQSELNNLNKQKSSLAGAIAELDLTRKKLNADISVTENKIEKTNLKIQSLSNDIGVKENSIGGAREAIALDIRRTNELEQNTLVETILSDNDFSLIWSDIEAMVVVREKIRENITKLERVKGELEGTRDETIAAKNELTALKSRLADQKKIVEQNTKEKNRLLAETKNSEANYQKLLTEQTAKKLAIEQELRDYESQLQFILDPSSLPSGRVLSWPLDNIFVTQLFGRTVAAQRLYASGSHSGVDFRAAVGTPVKAMADGVVGGVGDTDLTCAGASFGKWIFIEYTNGLSSTYGHLSLIKARAGQRVKRGEVVGYSGATGRVTGPHLHVTVYAAGAAKVETLPSKSCPGRTLTQPLSAINAYLDPMLYLPPYAP